MDLYDAIYKRRIVRDFKEQVEYTAKQKMHFGKW